LRNDRIRHYFAKLILGAILTSIAGYSVKFVMEIICKECFDCFWYSYVLGVITFVLFLIVIRFKLSTRDVPE